MFYHNYWPAGGPTGEDGSPAEYYCEFFIAAAWEEGVQWAADNKAISGEINTGPKTGCRLPYWLSR